MKKPWPADQVILLDAGVDPQENPGGPESCGPESWRRCRFFVGLPPRAQGRHRARGIALGNSKIRVQTYDDPASKSYKDSLLKVVKRDHALKAFAEAAALDDAPLLVDRLYLMAVPKSRRRAVDRAYVEGELIPAGKKPDIDNLDKAVFDALSGYFWKNDARVVGGRHLKMYAPETPGTLITVSRLKKEFLDTESLREILGSGFVRGIL